MAAAHITSTTTGTGVPAALVVGVMCLRHQVQDMKMYNYELEHICSVKVTLQNPPEVIGPTPDGLHLNIYITGGEVRGPLTKWESSSRGCRLADHSQ